ncbi:MAG: 4Fe-4S binding protein [Desulfobacterales bacterium]
MAQSKISSTRKKKIKTILSMMNKQNRRFIPIAPPLVEMMDLTTSDDELDYLLKMGTGLYDYEQAVQAAGMTDKDFKSFFETMKRKGLVHMEHDSDGKEKYRINAIAVGWYEAMMHYLMGKPQEKEFSKKWNAFFQFFVKFNFFPLRNLQNVVFRPFIKPTQDAVIMNPENKGRNKKKTIPINTEISSPDSKVYPTFRVNELVEKFGEQDAIAIFPCVCRHGKSLLDSSCIHEIPRESCMAFGDMANAWVSFGYGRKISKEEAIDILKEVRERGAVHSVIHERDDYSLQPVAICNCCWDCCGILKPYNMGIMPLRYQSSYVARVKSEENCKGCGNCEKYCPTTAMKVKDKKVTLNSDICIGCGQCAFQCRQNNIELVPHERMVFLPVLKKSECRITT